MYGLTFQNLVSANIHELDSPELLGRKYDTQVRCTHIPVEGADAGVPEHRFEDVDLGSTAHINKAIVKRVQDLAWVSFVAKAVFVYRDGLGALSYRVSDSNRTVEGDPFEVGPKFFVVENNLDELRLDSGANISRQNELTGYMSAWLSAIQKRSPYMLDSDEFVRIRQIHAKKTQN